MKKLMQALVCLFIPVVSIAQLPQKFDSLYKTIYAKDLCQMVQSTPGLVLIDVRSAGEYYDTSSFTGLNMGHLKGAVNLNVDDIIKDVRIMDPYKGKTFVLYCSHSQRSRKASKFLAENGFSNFYNLNGGMTSLHQLPAAEFPCQEKLLENKLAYKLVTPPEAKELLKEKNLTIIDVRTAQSFGSVDTAAQNNIGRIKGAINIPYAEIWPKVKDLNKNQSHPVLIYDSYGGDATRTASVMASMGYTKVYSLFQGIYGFLATLNDSAGIIMENPPHYKLVNVKGALDLLQKTPKLVIYDARPKVEFENKDERFWKTLGNIKKAVNVEEHTFQTFKMPLKKDVPILVYGQREGFKLADILAKKGYTNVYLMDGLYDFVWSAFNVENCKGALKYLENHGGLY